MNAAAREALRAWIDVYLNSEHGQGWTVIWRYAPSQGEPSAPRPPRPYASLNFVSLVPIGQVEESMVGDTEVMRLSQTMRATFDLSLYGTSKDEMLDAWQGLALALDRPSVRGGLLALHDLAYVRADGPRDGSVFRSVSWEGRAFGELVFTCLRTTTDEPGTIELIGSKLVLTQ